MVIYLQYSSSFNFYLMRIRKTTTTKIKWPASYFGVHPKPSQTYWFSNFEEIKRHTLLLKERKEERGEFSISFFFFFFFFLSRRSRNGRGTKSLYIDDDVQGRKTRIAFNKSIGQSCGVEKNSTYLGLLFSFDRMPSACKPLGNQFLPLSPKKSNDVNISDF